MRQLYLECKTSAQLEVFLLLIFVINFTNGGDNMNFIVGFIGAGKVGTTLGKYFTNNNIKLSGYYSNTKASSKIASEFTSSRLFESLEALILASNVIFITTPDDKIADVWNDVQKFNIKDKIICHTSGSLSSKIFSNIEASGAHGYSIHPMFAISDKFNTYKELKSAYFSIEGSANYLYELKHMFESFGNKTFLIDGDKKYLYHLANVTVSNLMLSLLEKGANYLAQCGIDKREALDALMPLINNNINNINVKGFKDALTGPIERGDIGTVKHHMEVIPEADKALYKILSLNLLKLSESKHPEKNYNELKDYLGGK